MSVYGPLEHLGIATVFQAVGVAVALLAVSGVALRWQLAASEGGVIPDEGVTLRNVFEVVVEGLSGVAENAMGHEWRTYFPLVGTLFFFILISNLLGLIPGLGGATSDVNTTAAWAIISVLVAEGVAVRKYGFGYLKRLMGPIPWLAWFFLPLEILLHGVRIMTLAIRLLANMFADHTVVGVWLTLVPVVIPALFLGLGMVIAVLQEFVFSLLTMVYIGEALEEAH